MNMAVSGIGEDNVSDVLPRLRAVGEAGGDSSALHGQSASTSHTARAPQGRATVEPQGLPEVPGVDLSGEPMRTFIAEGDVFTGSITAKNGIRVCGQLHGDIDCPQGTVLIQSGAYVSGSIRANGRVFIDGQVGADDAQTPVTVRTPDHLFLLDKAVVNASVEYGKLGTYGDTSLNGTMKKINASQRA